MIHMMWCYVMCTFVCTRKTYRDQGGAISIDKLKSHKSPGIDNIDIYKYIHIYMPLCFIYIKYI